MPYSVSFNIAHSFFFTLKMLNNFGCVILLATLFFLLIRDKFITKKDYRIVFFTWSDYKKKFWGKKKLFIFTV